MVQLPGPEKPAGRLWSALVQGVPTHDAGGPSRGDVHCQFPLERCAVPKNISVVVGAPPELQALHNVHRDTSWLNADAPLNILAMLVTDPVFQSDT